MYEIFAAINFCGELIFALAIQPQILDTRIISLVLKVSAIAKISGITVLRCVYTIIKSLVHMEIVHGYKLVRQRTCTAH